MKKCYTLKKMSEYVYCLCRSVQIKFLMCPLILLRFLLWKYMYIPPHTHIQKQIIYLNKISFHKTVRCSLKYRCMSEQEGIWNYYWDCIKVNNVCCIMVCVQVRFWISNSIPKATRRNGQIVEPGTCTFFWSRNSTRYICCCITFCSDCNILFP